MVEKAQHPKENVRDSNQAIVKATWDSVITAIQKGNRKLLNSLSLDSITACNKQMTPTIFLGKCAHELVNDLLLTRIKDSVKIIIQNYEIISSYYSRKFLSNLKHYGRTFFKKRVQVDASDTEPYVIAFDFIETKKGFKLFSCDVYGGPDCCR